MSFIWSGIFLGVKPAQPAKGKRPPTKWFLSQSKQVKWLLSSRPSSSAAKVEETVEVKLGNAQVLVDFQPGFYGIWNFRALCSGLLFFLMIITTSWWLKTTVLTRNKPALLCKPYRQRLD